uniref:Putative secreted peptide n=1 Tax=Anopheles braziliensis TaxID=58242 RepID=A0A2M3ZSB8_9DIPT
MFCINLFFSVCFIFFLFPPMFSVLCCVFFDFIDLIIANAVPFRSCPQSVLHAPYRSSVLLPFCPVVRN